MAYCNNCGSQINDNAVVCVKCGVAIHRTGGQGGDPGGKDWLTTLLLCLFLGCLGVHRFYSGSTVIGVLQLVTMGGCGIWTLIDFILIATNSYTDGQGNPLTRKH